MLSRQGVAMMTCAGLPEWVATSEDEFVQRAAAFAADVEGLATLRQGLRQRVQSSPLFDTDRFAAEFQDALEAMWAEKARA
jgi:protein O-GlcNAc transferase